MTRKINLQLAQFVLEKGTALAGIFGDIAPKIDSATFFIDPIKEELGIFENEIKGFVDLLESLRIIDKVHYGEAHTINPQMTGFAFDCEMDVPKMREFIKRGAGDSTIFDPTESQITFGLNEVKIPRDTGQFYFCKKMYEFPTDQWVSWDLIYSEAQGLKEIQQIPQKGEWKKVYDTMTEINKKAQDRLGIKELFQYNKHEFLRTI
jgi:hypothetical protein